VTELLAGVPFPAVALELLRLRAGHVSRKSHSLPGTHRSGASFPLM